MLIGAGIRASGGPLRYMGAPLAHAVERNTWAQAGAMRNWWAGQATVVDGVSIANKSSVPDGLRHPGSWLMAPKAGGMSSRNNTLISLSISGAGAGGITTTGTAAIVFTVAPASGELIAFGAGAATMTFTPNGTLLASISGTGSAAFSVATNTPTLGALASGAGAATIAFSAAADILPADDTSPTRTGTATFSFGGTLTPYAIGHMEGSTVDSTVLTSDAIASAVWGQVIEAGFSAEQIVRLLAAHAAGAATGLEGANPQFTGLDGSTIRIDGTYVLGTRTIDALDGS